MIRNVSAANLAAVVLRQVGTSAQLTPAQAATLKGLLADARYVGKTPAAVFPLMNAAYAAPNPTPQANVPAVIPIANWGVVMAPVAAAVNALPDAQPRKAGYLAWLAYPVSMGMQQVPLGGNVALKIFAGLVADGVITQAQATALTTMPDPAYVATVTAGPDSAEVAGAGVIIEISDIAAALAGSE